MTLPANKPCSECGSLFCGPVRCRFTDNYRFKKPYQPADQTDVSRWLTEQDISNIKRHCGG